MPEPLRFVLDVHLGKLAKYLRMLGIDSLYEKETDDRTLIHHAYLEARILLSKDRLLIESVLPAGAYIVRSNHAGEQLREVLRRFDLKSAAVTPLTRCLECNSLIVSIDKGSVAGKVPEGVFSSFHEFFFCEQCRKIYWKGSHYEHMKNFVRDCVEKTQGSLQIPGILTAGCLSSDRAVKR